jgi:OOP family OmpA-OmpF porin
MNKLLIAAGLLAATFAAQAQTYVTGSVGMSRHDVDCAGASTCDKSGSAFKLMGGYKFSPVLAGEFGYMDFGKSKAADSQATVRIGVSGFGGGLAVRADMSPTWVLTARLGLASLDTKLDASLVGVGSGSDTDNNRSLYAGLGRGYRLQQNLSLDLSFDSSKGKYDKNGVSTSGNVSAFSVGLTYDL